MSDELDKLKSAMDAATPEVDSTAKMRAIDVGMAAFEENFQGSEDGVRPTREQAQWWALILRGIKDMFKSFTSRQAMMASVSVATLAVAVVITGQFQTGRFDDSLPFPQDAIAPTSTAEPMAIASDLSAKSENEVSVVQQPTPMLEMLSTDATPTAPTMRTRELSAIAPPPSQFENEGYMQTQNTEKFPDSEMNTFQLTILDYR